MKSIPALLFAFAASRETRLSNLTAKAQAGTADAMEILSATDDLLAAKQARLEIQGERKTS